MILRIKKIHILIFAFMLVSVSFIFTIKSEKIEKTSGMNNGLKLPIVMYHHITQDKEKAGKYVVTTEELENDLIYLNKCGYNTVLVADLIKYTENQTDLPRKSVMITFDDGFKSVIKLALPLLEKHKMKAVIAPVGAITEEYTKNGNTDINYSYLTWEELKNLDANPLIEIQSHTYNLHTLSKNENGRNAMAKSKNETYEQYRSTITNVLTIMQNELKSKSNINAVAIAYPYGLYSDTTLKIIKEIGFKTNFLCEERINIIYKGDKESIYNLGRFNRPSGVDTEDFFKKMSVYWYVKYVNHA